jgi:hypothetical protein
MRPFNLEPWLVKESSSLYGGFTVSRVGGSIVTGS